MILTMPQQLAQIRADALQQGFPADDVERWIATAIPCGTLTPGGDGPVVGRFGGTAMVPRGTQVPGDPLVATIDCAALPRQATDLPLPPDGQLLLFGYPEGGDYYSQGSALYVPAGVAVEEPPKDEELDEDEDEEFLEVCQSYPQGDIHLTIDVSLPSHTPAHLNPKLIDYWSSKAPISSKWGGVQIGGHASACDFRGNDGPLGVVAEYAGKAEQLGYWRGSGSPSPRVEDWVLLAEFLCSSEMRPGGAALYWGIQRDELAARRFDGVYAVVDWNP
ncbi:DUF1963 domain-containing protein [Micromonospora sp. NBC_00858]|uniref:DUF1963 domain-containing protein n=1 Tax=Micromonospora sp. NBC_00858 TaxID=2975979 RepID=UPI003866C4A5|nr:YwqG family protein [Micromonospora sp. NBC_00858]